METIHYVEYIVLALFLNLGDFAASALAHNLHDDFQCQENMHEHVNSNTYFKSKQQLLMVAGNVSQGCQNDLDVMLSNKTTSGDSIYALDAFGKPGSGILAGDLVWLGTYEECQSLDNFHYCLVDLLASVPYGEKDLLNQTRSLPIRWGTCFPTSCNENDVFNGIPQILDGVVVNIPFNVTLTKVQCSNPMDMWADGIFVFTFILCCVLICLMLSGYGLDVLLRLQAASASGSLSDKPVVCNGLKSVEETPLLTSRQENKRLTDDNYKLSAHSLPCRFLLCFALNRNLTKLLDTHQSDRSILCLNGIRVLSMFWVILGHTCSLVLYTQLVDNLTTFAPITQQFGFQVILNATFAVDTFFLLSGLLVTLGCINRMEKNNGNIPWLWFYFHRYWRLTPALLFLILITMIMPYFTEGPAWLPAIENMADKCQEYWWVTILYVQNFYPGFAKQCAGHTWYLANDMQFFIVSPVFIILLYKFRRLGLACIAITCLVSFAVTIGLMVNNGFNLANQAIGIAGGTNGNANLGGFGYQDIVYQKPYCRIPVYLVGMVIGLIIQKNINRRIRISKINTIIGWLTSTVLSMLVIYGLYPAISQNRSLQPEPNALYAALSRFTWGVVVSWVIFACYFGYGGPINLFLSWRGWVPISRLTYTAYLIHLPIVYVYYQSHKITWHLSLLEFAFNFVGFVGLTYGAALLFSLAVEYPFANMEKLFLPRTLAENNSRKTLDSDDTTLAGETPSKNGCSSLGGTSKNTTGV